MSWASLAAQEIVSRHPRTSSRGSSGSSSQPLPLVSTGANPRKASEAKVMQHSQSAPALDSANGPGRPSAPKAPVATPDASLKSRRPSMQTSRAQSKPTTRPSNEGKREGMDEIAYMCRSAKKMHIPVATAKQAAVLFREFGDLGSRGLITEWRISRAQFVKVLCKLAGKSTEKDLDESLLEASFFDADIHRRGWLDFDNLAFWLSTNSFSEDVNLDDEQRELRNLARRYNMHISSVEKYKQDFDVFDADGSGAIDPDEFDNLVHRCAKVPGKLRLPATRIRQFWRDADTDENGGVDFEEFLVFQRKYFATDEKSGVQRNGFEDYYRGVRKTCWN